jgi:CheY-like chemotaxis protein
MVERVKNRSTGWRNKVADLSESRIRLLVIDDDPDIRRGIKISLQHEGIEVAGAASGEEGLELARKIHPDIIILDVEMPPGMGGPEVCKRIRSDRSLKHGQISHPTNFS